MEYKRVYRREEVKTEVPHVSYGREAKRHFYNRKHVFHCLLRELQFSHNAHDISLVFLPFEQLRA